MAKNAKTPAPVLVDLPGGRSSAWHSGIYVFPPEQHRRTRPLSAAGGGQSTPPDVALTALGDVAVRAQKTRLLNVAFAW